MKTYIVQTKWIGYSEYKVKAKSKAEAEKLFMNASTRQEREDLFDSEEHTYDGLLYGGNDCEEFVEVRTEEEQ